MKKYNYDVSKLGTYLSVYRPENIRIFVFGFTSLITIVGLILAIGDPFVKPLFLIVMPIVVIIDLFGIVFFFGRYRFQLQFVLYCGIYGIALPIVFYVDFIKLSYFVVGITSLALYIVTGAILIVVPIVVLKLTVRSLKTGYFAKPKKAVNYAVIAFFSIIGVFGSKFFVKTNRELSETKIVIFVMGLLLLLLAYIVEMAIYNIHKYYIMKRYISFVKLIKPDKKRKNSHRKVQAVKAKGEKP